MLASAKLKTVILWLRYGSLAVIAALGIGDVAVHYPPYSPLQSVGVALIHVTYAILFFRNTAPYPRRLPYQRWLLLAQLLLPSPIPSDLGVLTFASIPLTLEKRLWRRWLIASLAFTGLQLTAHTLLALYNNRENLPKDATPTMIVLTIVFGTLQTLAWHLFAYLAALIIVRSDEDRTRLALLNAEMRGAQILLLESGRLAERLRISRELHDSLGHHLTSLSLQLRVAEYLPDAELRPQVTQAGFLAKLLLAEIREAVSEWRSETSPALPEALQSLAAGLPGLKVNFDSDAELPAAAPAVTHALFRCAQEALTNAIRHGMATNATVALHSRDQRLSLTIADDGYGCSVVTPGNGLNGMVARMAEFGGTVNFESSAGKGFRTEINVPLPELVLQ